MIPAPAWWQPPAGTRSHRISRWRRNPVGSLHGVCRCGEPTNWTGTPWLGGTVTDHPTRPVCRVCVPARRLETAA